MSIVPSDILFMLSAPNATAGLTQPGNPGLSWGNYVSTTVMSSTPLDNLFQDITGPENAGSQVDYACLFVYNNTLSGDTMLNTLAWLPSSFATGGGASIAIALDPAGMTLATTSSAQATRISSAIIAPTGVSGWVSPVSSQPSGPSFTGGLQMGSIPPGYVYPMWVRRTAANTAPVSNDSFRIQISFGSN